MPGTVQAVVSVEVTLQAGKEGDTMAEVALRPLEAGEMEVEESEATVVDGEQVVAGVGDEARTDS